MDGASLVVVASANFAPRTPEAKSNLYRFMRSTSTVSPYVRKGPVKVVFVPPPVRLRYALRWTKLNELEAEVGRTEALYAAVTEEGRVAEEEGSSLTAVRTRLEREMVQIGACTVWCSSTSSKYVVW